MRVLVTGADGYVGRFLVDTMLRDRADTLYTLDLEGASARGRRTSGVQHFSLSKTGSQARDVREVIEAVRPEAIIHLAALVRVSDAAEQLHDVIRSNIELGALLLQHGTTAGLKFFVDTGTFWEEMNTRGEYNPVDLYAASKRAFQAFLPLYCSAHNLRAVTLRPFGIFGPSDSRRNLLFLIDEAVREGKPLDLSPGGQVLELVYVKDLCRAYLCALDALARLDEPACLDPLEIGNGEGKTLREVVELYTSVNGWRLDARWGAIQYRPREVMNRMADLELTARVIGWTPQYTLKSAFLDMRQA